MVQVDSISKRFRDKTLFSELSLTIEKGEVCGLVGLNGVGKTTLLRIICGTITPDSGTVTTMGVVPGQNGDFYRRIGIVLDSDGFNGNLTFLENLNFFSKIRRIPQASMDSYVHAYWSHIAKKPIPVKQFSRGERMQCSLARAFLGEPDLLLLDEPASNLDAHGYALLCTLVRDAQARGAASLISSHRLDAVSELCENAAFLSSKGLDKRSLTDDAGVEWILRGKSLLKAIECIENRGAVLIHTELYEMRFNNISRDQIETLIPELVERGVVVWELFMNDRVRSVMETL